MDAKKYIGKLVVVAHWDDFDYPMDPVQLGILERIEDERFYIMGSKRGWQHCRPVSRRHLKIESKPNTDSSRNENEAT